LASNDNLHKSLLIFLCCITSLFSKALHTEPCFFALCFLLTDLRMVEWLGAWIAMLGHGLRTPRTREGDLARGAYAMISACFDAEEFASKVRGCGRAGEASVRSESQCVTMNSTASSVESASSTGNGESLSSLCNCRRYHQRHPTLCRG